MITKKVGALVLGLIAGGGLLVNPIQAWARGGGDHYERKEWRRNNHYRSYDRHHHYPSYGRVVFSLPRTFISIVIGGQKYHYCDGVYYRKYSNEYVIVAPPIGAVVTSIPLERETVIVEGKVYYVINGVYYKHTIRGYEVVPQPNVTVLETGVLSSGTDLVFESGTFTVNIPNNRGGYIAVTLKRSGQGFIGPQGEFYEEFPKVDQLKVMYAKQ